MNELATDIALTLRHSELRPVYRIGVHRYRRDRSFFEDLNTIDGLENLAQAVMMRLLTPVGELASLGHPEYGSRLHELIGRENTQTTRNLIKLYILESLALEPRIAEMATVRVAPGVAPRTRVDVELQIVSSTDAQPFTVGPFSLELGS
jgi:phage baseplate assembly protein W